MSLLHIVDWCSVDYGRLVYHRHMMVGRLVLVDRLVLVLALLVGDFMSDNGLGGGSVAVTMALLVLGADGREGDGEDENLR